jgi:hypothetical protein
MYVADYNAAMAALRLNHLEFVQKELAFYAARDATKKK